MVRKNHDSKFVIYQVLYIFVITVLALKGASLDLGEVVSKDESVNKSVRDSLIVIIDSLQALGLKFNIEIDTTVIEENQELKDKVDKLNQKIAQMEKKKEEQTPPPKKKEEKKEEPVEDIKLPSPFSKSQTFLQYAWNIAENKGTVPVSIYDPNNLTKPLVVVKKGESKKFDLENQKIVILRYGKQEERIKVLENKPPLVKIDVVTNKMNQSDIYVKDLQRTTCFNVIISDERIDQLDVKFSGHISVGGPLKDSNGNLVYNVSLNLAGTEDRYDKWIDQNENMREPDGRYKTNFFFTVIDRKSKQRVQVGDSFYFTDYSK